MEPLLYVGLSNAVVASILAVGAALAGLIVRRPAVAHSLWLLVLLKLITPPLVPVAVDWPHTEARELSADVSALASLSPIEPEPAFVDDNAPSAAAEAEPALDFSPAPPPAMVVAEIEPVDSIMPAFEPDSVSPALLATEPLSAWHLPPWPVWLLASWITGSLCWVVLAVWRIARFSGLVQRQARPACSAVTDRVRQLCERLGIATLPRVAFVPGCVSPLIWGLCVPPRLLLPSALWDQLDDAQRDALLVHELAHLKRKDHWIRNLELTGLYWWHPVVWWARKALREAEEECCDAWVVWALPQGARSYATALLETVEFLSCTRPGLPVAASGLGHLSSLKRRLTMILQEPKPRTLSRAGRVSVACLAALMLPLAPSWAQRAANDDNEPKQQAGRVDADDKDDDDKDDGPRERGRKNDNDKDDMRRDRLRDQFRRRPADRKDQRPEQRDRERDEARAQLKQLTDELAERRERSRGEIEKARAQLEALRAESNRELVELQLKIAEATRRAGGPEFQFRMADPQGGRGGRADAQRPILPGGRSTFPFDGPGGRSRAAFPFDGPGGRGMPRPGGPGAGPPDGPRGIGGGSPPQAPRGIGGGMRGGPSDPATERRFNELEKKLDRLLDEVSKLKQPQASRDDRNDEEAKADLARAEDRLDWAARMLNRGYVSQAQQTAEVLSWQRARIALEQARAKQKPQEQDKP